MAHSRPQCCLLHLAEESLLSASLSCLAIQSLPCLPNFSAVYIYSSQENYKQGVWHTLYYTCSLPSPPPHHLNKTQLRVEETFNKYRLLNA